MDKVFEDIALDMRILKEKSHTVLKKVGRTASLNYLLYGDPGTGKTSTIKAIGSMYNMDIYIASFNQHVNEDIIQRIMTPIVKQNVLLLVEDFDRYLTSETSSRQVSSFLNALDGVEPSDGVIRFFTANDPSIIAENKALLSRMQRIIKYGAPSADSIAKRVVQIFENAPEDLVTRFSNEAEKRELSLRDVTNLLCRNMFRENGLQDSLDQIDDFAQEKVLYPQTQGSKKQDE
jgi:SpoVK/Ycf46/Vps4 family AAA+-type ATPase